MTEVHEIKCIFGIYQQLKGPVLVGHLGEV